MGKYRKYVSDLAQTFTDLIAITVKNKYNTDRVAWSLHQKPFE